ncbi:GCN5-related N-acetyltransferase [Parafrankia sp. EAN1pec]|nr:GCN5-related N-acetyltransferase [Frankia sp. EAN1pec]
MPLGVAVPPLIVAPGRAGGPMMPSASAVVPFGGAGSVASSSWSKCPRGGPEVCRRARPVSPATRKREPVARRARRGGCASGGPVTADPASVAGGDALVAPKRVLPPEDVELARELEEVAHRAWPPLREWTHGGWVLRESAGSSRRGNSVWARGDVPDLAAALRAVHSFYTAAGLPPTFQITPVARPAGLLDALDAAGYDDGGPTDVCVAPLAALRAPRPDAAEHRPGPAGGPGADRRVESAAADLPDERWLAVAGDVLATFAGQRVGTLAVVRAMALPQRYVTVFVDGRPVGVGRGVLDGSWLGIYSMATLPAARGVGVAGRTLAELAHWAGARGAERAYLQVERHSVVARGLYARRGFRPVYGYSYRRLPAPSGLQRSAVAPRVATENVASENVASAWPAAGRAGGGTASR